MQPKNFGLRDSELTLSKLPWSKPVFFVSQVCLRERQAQEALKRIRLFYFDASVDA